MTRHAPDDARLAEIRREVGERLAAVQGDIPDDAFADLLDRIAAQQLRDEQQMRGQTHPRNVRG